MGLGGVGCLGGVGGWVRSFLASLLASLPPCLIACLLAWLLACLVALLLACLVALLLGCLLGCLVGWLLGCLTLGAGGRDSGLDIVVISLFAFWDALKSRNVCLSCVILLQSLRHYCLKNLQPKPW